MRIDWKTHWRIGKSRAERWLTGGGSSPTFYTGAETVVLIAAVVAAAASAAGTYMAVSAQKKQAEAASNAAALEAEQARRAGEAAAEAHREQVRRAAASFGSRAGAAGVVGGVGSPLLAEMELVRLGEEEAQRKLYGYELQAQAGGLMLGQIFMATVTPDTRVGLTGMISGFVDRQWAKHHYRRWYEEHHGTSEPVAASIVEPAQPKPCSDSVAGVSPETDESVAA